MYVFDPIKFNLNLNLNSEKNSIILSFLRLSLKFIRFFKYLKNGIFLTCDNSSKGSTSMGHFTALDLSEKSSGRK